MNVHVFLCRCTNMVYPLAAMICVGLSRGWGHWRSWCLCNRTGTFYSWKYKMLISSSIYSYWLFVCVCVNYWPPVKTVSTHFRGPKWAMSSWHCAGFVSLHLWHCSQPVFHCHLLPVSGQAAGRGQMSRLVLEIKRHCAVFTSHLTDTQHHLHIVLQRLIPQGYLGKAVLCLTVHLSCLSDTFIHTFILMSANAELSDQQILWKT